MREAEDECQKVKDQIKKAEFLLSENKKFHSNTQHLLHEDEQNSQTSPEDDVKKVIETRLPSEKTTRKTISSPCLGS